MSRRATQESSTIVFVRPTRACILVRSVEGIPCERLVEHALATQARVWCADQTLVVPLGSDLPNEELFCGLLIAVSAPSASHLTQRRRPGQVADPYLPRSATGPSWGWFVQSAKTKKPPLPGAFEVGAPRIELGTSRV